MSTAVTLFGGKLPAYLQNAEMDATTKALAGGSAAGRRISIKGAVFRMMVDGKQVAENDDRAMNVVVVAAASSINRQFYSGEYDEANIAPPTCWSADGKTPSREADKPQSQSCDTCPQNIAGSGKGESRACRYQQRLAVVLEGEIDGPVYQLALPATSLFGKGEANGVKLPLQAYARFLAQNNMPITAVVTEMRFDTASATPKLTFKATRPLTEAEYGTVQEQGASTDAHDAITLTVFKQDTKAKTAKAKPAVEPEVEAESEAEVEAEAAPVKAPPAKAKPAAPAAKKSVAEVIGAWDD